MEKTVLRNKSISTKVSDEEYSQLEKLGLAQGLMINEWTGIAPLLYVGIRQLWIGMTASHI